MLCLKANFNRTPPGSPFASGPGPGGALLRPPGGADGAAIAAAGPGAAGAELAGPGPGQAGGGQPREAAAAGTPQR